MAAILGGTMRAPLTAIVFAFGLTHDANAFLPTILGCAVAYGFTVIVLPRSILTEKIARRGRHVYREYGVDPLERHFVEEVMTRAVRAITDNLTLEDVHRLHFGPGQTHRAYPVISGERLLGVLDREVLDKGAAEDPGRPVGELFSGEAPPAFALPHESCRTIAERLVSTGLERLPVIADTDSRRLVGIVSRSDLLKPLRVRYEEEVLRERVFLFGSE
jgi:CBS domain-containing protein